jgi:site-specific DNA recombinase
MTRTTRAPAADDAGPLVDVVDIAALYPRVSTPRQVGNNSTKDQLHNLVALGTDRGLPVVRYADDLGVSGASLKKRADLNRLLDHVQAGEARDVETTDGRRIARARIVSLICVDWSRMSRDMDLIDAMTIKVVMRDGGVKILTPGRVYDLDDEGDDMMVNFEAVVAAAARLKTIKFTTRGRYVIAAEGRWPGAVVLYGYRAVYDVPHADGRPRSRLEIDPTEASVVRLCYELYADGLRPTSGAADGTWRPLSQQGVADELNRRGYRFRERHYRDPDKQRYPNGHAWTQYDVMRVLRNARYVGQWGLGIAGVSRYARDLGPVVRDIPELQIVSAELWLRTQALREQRARTTPRSACPTRPLQGLLRCPHCGSGLVAKAPAKSSRSGRREAAGGTPAGFYACAAYLNYRADPDGGCRSKTGYSIRCTVARRAVDALFLEVFTTLDRDRILQAGIDVERAEARRGRQHGFRERLADLEVRRQRLVDAVEKGSLADGDVRARRLALDAEAAALRQREAQEQRAGAERSELAHNAARVRGREDVLLAELAVSDPAMYRQMVGLFFEQLEVIAEGPRRTRTARVLRFLPTVGAADALAEAGYGAAAGEWMRYPFEASVLPEIASRCVNPFDAALSLLARAEGVPAA